MVLFSCLWPTYKEEIRDDDTRVSKMQESTHLRQACAHTITVTPTGAAHGICGFALAFLRRGSVTLPRSCAAFVPTHMAFFSILLGWFGKTVREWLCRRKKAKSEGGGEGFPGWMSLDGFQICCNVCCVAASDLRETTFQAVDKRRSFACT